MAWKRSLYQNEDRDTTSMMKFTKTKNQAEKEIRELKERLRDLETETVIGHHAPEAPKNLIPVQRDVMNQNEDGTNEINEISEMHTYLAGVMAAITNFKKKLSTQPGTSPTPMDRS